MGVHGSFCEIHYARLAFEDVGAALCSEAELLAIPVCTYTTLNLWRMLYDGTESLNIRIHTILLTP